MANKTFNTRIKNKRDTAANWEKVATTFQPLDGELIVVDTAAGKTRFKVGRYDSSKDRLLYYNEIPFTDEYLYNDLNESQGKIYDTLNGIDERTIIESTLEPSDGNGNYYVYKIGLWQFPKSGFYKLKLSQFGTSNTSLWLCCRKTNDDGTTTEDFSVSSITQMENMGSGDGKSEYLFVLADYLDDDKQTCYKIQFLNFFSFANTVCVNTYDKTTKKWAYTSAHNTRLSLLTFKKGDTNINYNGTTAQTVEIPTKTSELTNDSFVSYAEQTLTEDQQNQAKTNLGIDALTGNTTAITPTQVKEAILNGRPVSITYTDTTYGNLTFTSFGYSLENNVVVANLVSTYNTRYTLADLVGMSNNDQWTLKTTELGTSTDIDNLRLNIANDYVKYSGSQTLADEQKAIARTNIGAISEAELVQPDWNQNDETAKDYIKNRICYNNISFLGSVVFTADSTSSLKYTSTSKDLTLYNAIIDAKYGDNSFPNLIVQVNGVEYLSFSQNGYMNGNVSFQDNVSNVMRKLRGDLNKPTASNTAWTIKTPKYAKFTVDSEYEVKFYSNKATRIPSNLISPEIFQNPDFPINVYSYTNDYFMTTQSITFWPDINGDTTGNKAVSFAGKAKNAYSFSHGHYKNIASGAYSHAEGGEASNWGDGTTASGQASHSEGSGTIAEGAASHAEGYYAAAKGKNSHAEGYFTIASGENSHAEGKYNIEDSENLYANIVGNGSTSNARSNAHTLDWQGNAWYSGNVYVGSTSGTNKDEGSKKLATEEYVNNHSTTITIDTELSTTSTNAIQNKAVKTAIDSLQTAVDSKVDITALNHGLTQVVNDVAANYVKFTAEQTLTDEQKAQARDNINAPSPADAVYTVTASSTDGVAYTATVSGIDSLTVGASFIMVPNKTSASQEPTLNVNGLGAKKIRRRLNNLVTVTSKGYSNTWISANKPFSLIYDGTYWIVEGMEQPVGADMYGTVPMATADANGNNIADTYATIAMLQSMLPKVTTINLVAGWGGNSSPYYQDVTLSCCTETSVVDLQPTPAQLASWQDEGLAFTTQSGNGIVRVYVAGGKPSGAISIQVKVQEVVEV